MGPLGLVQLPALMDRTSGRTQIRIGLIDASVELDEPDLVRANIHKVPGKVGGTCNRAATLVCSHTHSHAMFDKRPADGPCLCYRMAELLDQCNFQP